MKPLDQSKLLTPSGTFMKSEKKPWAGDQRTRSEDALAENPLKNALQRSTAKKKLKLSELRVGRNREWSVDIHKVGK